MARLFHTGWEMGSSLVTPATADAVSLTTSNVRTGTYALTATGEGVRGVSIDLGADYDELYTRIAFRPSENTNGQYGGSIIVFQTATARNKVAVRCSGGSMTLNLSRMDEYGNWTILEGGTTLTIDTWYVIEAHVTIANSGGIFQVKLDGVMDMDFTGDTLDNQAETTIRTVQLCRCNGSNASWGAPGLYDDWAINDTSGSVNNSWVGRGGCEALLPSAAGTTTGLTPSTGANYACVDELPPSDTDYVGASTVDLFDTYAMSNTAISGDVGAVMVWMRSALSGAGSGNIAPVLRLDGTDYTGTDQGLDVTYTYKRQLYETSPDTAVAWTTGELDGIEAGPKVR